MTRRIVLITTLIVSATSLLYAHDLFIKLDVFNIFNEQAVVDFDETVLTEDDEDWLILFNPFTETAPIECPQGAAPEVCEDMGAHFQLGEYFGLPEGESDYQRPRTFVVSFGIRF